MDAYFKWFGLPGSVVLTTLLSSLALVLAIIQPTLTRWICFAAMALSSVGDIFLARFKGLDRIFPNYFTIGAVFFMAAHLMYILCYGMKIHTAGLTFCNGGVIAAGFIGLFAAALLCKLAIDAKNTQALPMILIYAVILCANCASVFSYAWSQGFSSLSAIAAVLGVISFFLSDLVIGLGLSGNIHRFDGLIWWLYPIGQLLLILGV